MEKATNSFVRYIEQVSEFKQAINKPQRKRFEVGKHSMYSPIQRLIPCIVNNKSLGTMGGRIRVLQLPSPHIHTPLRVLS